jgi:predicted HTH transcriptional regulator
LPSTQSLSDLLQDIRGSNRESEWVEFKVDDDEPEEIGQYVSALANSAALVGKRYGYLVWGINNINHDIVGTKVRLVEKKVGNEELENWLSHLLFPGVDLRIVTGDIDRHHVELLEIPAAAHTPVRFRDYEYVRVGSYKKKLKDHPEKERSLWKILERRTWETEHVASYVADTDVLALIDYPTFFDLLGKPLPDRRASILQALVDEGVIAAERGETFSITNLGGILFGRDLTKLTTLSRKAVRLVVYKDRDRTETVREQPGVKGYASGFAGLVSYLSDLLPLNEQIKQAFRTEVRMYPEIAIRELIANALIHQDFNLSGTGPLVEVFSDRIEITNPGTPLIEPDRFLDSAPRSRNEKIAALMRRMNICEERGSGIDKVVKAAEAFQLPAPRFDTLSEHTKATLFAPRKLADMDKDDRIRACYQHASLRYISNDFMTNTSLRQRFAIADENYAIASRIIAETIESGLVKRLDPESKSKKHAKYIPYWA